MLKKLILTGVIGLTFSPQLSFAQIPDCDDPQVDCIRVIGQRTDYSPGSFGWWDYYSTGSALGGSTIEQPPSTTQSAPWDEPGSGPDPIVHTSEPDKYAIDLDGDGVADHTYAENFLIRGPDTDGDGKPDLWHNMKTQGRAWLIP